MGAESAETRLKLIKAATLIVRKDGFGSLTAARLAKMVGLKRQIVHYYFASMTDLVLAVIRLEGAKFRKDFTAAIGGHQPLRETLALAAETIPISYELLALALKNKAIAAELKRDAEAVRRIETEAVVQNLENRRIQPQIPPIAAVLILRATVLALAMENELGVSDGHAETRAFLEQWLHSLMNTGKLPHGSQTKKQPETRKNKAPHARSDRSEIGAKLYSRRRPLKVARNGLYQPALVVTQGIPKERES
jgi:AcrR family transcriptional regulator